MTGVRETDMNNKEEFKALTDWEELSQEVQRGRRKHKRVAMTFPVEVSGFDPNGRLFCERTVTQDISATGCRILLKTQIGRGEVVAIRLLSRGREGASPSRPLLFQVIWVAREGEGWIAGALMLQQEKFWQMEFPGKTTPLGTRS